MTNIKNIIGNFLTEGEFLSATPYGSGHINDTYLIECNKKDGQIINYILQRVNQRVFPDIKGLMDNITGVTEFIKQKKRQNNKDTLRDLTIIRTKEGASFYKDEDGNFFRLYNYIGNSKSIESVPTPKEMFISGVGYGQFQRYLDGYPVDKLKESIPDFHNTAVRLENFKKAIKQDSQNRVKDTQNEINFFLERADYANKIVELLDKNIMPKRVTHNDTKLNNILIDIVKDEAVAAVDLDTVMAGSVVYDFGDSIRSGANLGAEDEIDLEKVVFSLEHYEAFCKGFLSQVKDILTDVEIENMAFGAILMTYECGMRFLTDHLNGDVYFKIHRQNHNLDRARTQIKMVQDMEKLFDKMNKIVYNNVN